MAFKTQKNPDGTITVLDVPIFPECKRGEDEYGPDWIQQEFERLNACRDGGHMIPVHVEHYGTTPERPEHAGLVDPRRVGPLRWRGKDRECIFTNLILTNEDVAERVANKELPYRSVEMSDDNEDGSWEIVSLALMVDPPYVEMPMTFIEGQDVAYETNGVVTYTKLPRSDSPVLCFKRAGHSQVVYMEAAMPKPKPNTLKFMDGDEDKKPDDGDGKKMGDESGTGATSIADIDLSAMTGTPEEWAAFVAQAQAVLDGFNEGEAEADAGEEVPTKPSDNPPDVVAMQKAAQVRAEEHAKTFALETRVSAMENERERDAEIATIRADLESKRIAYSGDPAAKLLSEYDEGAKEGGHKLGMFQLRHFASMAKGGAFPAAPSAFDTAGAAASDLPDEAKDICTGDPVHDEAVARAHVRYQKTARAGFSKIKFSAYWAANQRAFLTTPVADATKGR